MDRLIQALDAGWMTLYVVGDTRMMYHREHGKMALGDIPDDKLSHQVLTMLYNGYKFPIMANYNDTSKRGNVYWNGHLRHHNMHDLMHLIERDMRRFVPEY